MKRRVWKQIVIPVPSSHHELLTASLASLGCTGFLQESDHLVCFMNKNKWTPTRERELQNMLRRFQKELPGIEARFALSDVHEQNWNARWERSIGILEATDRIIVKPSWRRLRKKDRGKIVLHVDPKMSFGTGHHETTRLSLVLLQRHLRQQSTVLDFGTGTGILALAARKLGARVVFAIDNDEWSIENARENASTNKAGRSVRVVRGGIQSIPKNRFDLAVANIDLPTIERALRSLLGSLRPGGILILSGLLATDLDSLLNLLKNKAAYPLELLTENEWIAISLLKP